MTRYTWTHTGRTGARTYLDTRREITATIDKTDGVWSWSVTQFGSELASGYAQRLAFARTEAETWIATLTEVTPV